MSLDCDSILQLIEHLGFRKVLRNSIGGAGFRKERERVYAR